MFFFRARGKILPEPVAVVERNKGPWSRKSYSGEYSGELDTVQRPPGNRYSDARAKARNASISATRKLSVSTDLAQDELRELVTRAVAKAGVDLVSQPDPNAAAQRLQSKDYESILRFLLLLSHREQLIPELGLLATLGLPATMTTDEFGGYYRRFEQVASQHAMLRMHDIDHEATCIKLSAEGANLPAGGDSLVLAAAHHCPKLISVTLLHGSLRDSSLTTVARTLGERLMELDLTGTQGFSDLALKSVAAYCPALQTLRLSHCLSVTQVRMYLHACPRVHVCEYIYVCCVCLCAHVSIENLYGFLQ